MIDIQQLKQDTDALSELIQSAKMANVLTNSDMDVLERIMNALEDVTGEPEVRDISRELQFGLAGGGCCVDITVSKIGVMVDLYDADDSDDVLDVATLSWESLNLLPPQEWIK